MSNTTQEIIVEELQQEITKLKEEVEMYRASDSIRKDNLKTLKAKINELFTEFMHE